MLPPNSNSHQVFIPCHAIRTALRTDFKTANPLCSSHVLHQAHRTENSRVVAVAAALHYGSRMKRDAAAVAAAVDCSRCEKCDTAVACSGRKRKCTMRVCPADATLCFYKEGPVCTPVPLGKDILSMMLLLLLTAADMSPTLTHT